MVDGLFTQIGAKTSAIEEVDHEVWIGHPICSVVKETEEEKNQTWPKVSMIKGMFEDLSCEK